MANLKFEMGFESSLYVSLHEYARVVGMCIFCGHILGVISHLHWYDFRSDYFVFLCVVCIYCLIRFYILVYVCVISSALIELKFVYDIDHNWSISYLSMI